MFNSPKTTGAAIIALIGLVASFIFPVANAGFDFSVIDAASVGSLFTSVSAVIGFLVARDDDASDA